MLFHSICIISLTWWCLVIDSCHSNTEQIKTDIDNFYYELPLQLISQQWGNCSIHLIIEIENVQHTSDFIKKVSMQYVPVTISYIFSRKQHHASSGFHYYTNQSQSPLIRQRYCTEHCNLFIIDVNKEVKGITSIIRRILYPKPSHKAHCIFINRIQIPPMILKNTIPNSSYLLLPELQNIPFKMEICLRQNQFHQPRLLLYGTNDLRPKFHGRIGTLEILAGYDSITGLQIIPKKSLFPQSQFTNFQQKKFVVTFPVKFYQKHKFADTRLVSIQIQSAFKEVVKFLKIKIDANETIFTKEEPTGIKYHKELNNALNLNPYSVSLLFFNDEVNTYHLQPSSYYTYYRCTLIYTKVKINSHRLVKENFERPVNVLTIPAIGAAIFIMFSRKWDLVTVLRLPRPLNNNVWKFYSREITM